MSRAFGVLALLCAALCLVSYQRYIERRPIADAWQDNQYDQNQNDNTYDDQSDQAPEPEPLPPPNTYIPGEKKGIVKDIGKQGVGQIKLKDRPDSRTKKERTQGPSLPLVPNKGS